MTVPDITRNLERIRQNIAQAARRSGRQPEGIRLVAVTKTVGNQQIKQALAAGVDLLGESRVQEMVDKYPEFPDARWHFIGHLQRNKVKFLVERVDLIHSLDRWSLAEELDRRARERESVFRVLVQVNVADDGDKHGFLPAEIPGVLRELAGLAGLRVEGLMCIAPFEKEPERIRPIFRQMKRLFDQCTGVPGVKMRFLSMGMSSDYAVAVEEGANLVRLGTAVFGPRNCSLREG